MAVMDLLRGRHPVLAAALSFLFPGLGQAYAGQPRLAALLAAPPLLLIVIALLAALWPDRSLLNTLLSSEFLSGLLVANVALMAWRLFGVAQAGLQRRPTRAAIATVTLLGIITVGMHAYAGDVIVRLDSALAQVFSGEEPPPGAPLNAGTPLGPAGPDDPSLAWDGTEPINFLLLGVDAAPRRSQSLTDTILVVSVDPLAHQATMVSVPRDTGFMPLPDTRIYGDGLFPMKINELATAAHDDPELWCPEQAQPAECGLSVLRRSVGLYLGIEMGYHAQVDLAGFADLIDAVGGVTLCLPGTLRDPAYDDPRTGARGLVLPAGCHDYGGTAALAYTRSRQGVVEMPDGTLVPQDDFQRAERQQQVLLALRGELAEVDYLFELPALLDAIGRTVSTDFPRSQAADLWSLLPLITDPDIERVVLGLPDFVDPPVDPVRNYLLIPRRDAIREEAERLFGDRGPLKGWYVGSHDEIPQALVRGDAIP